MHHVGQRAGVRGKHLPVAQPVVFTAPERVPHTFSMLKGAANQLNGAKVTGDTDAGNGTVAYMHAEHSSANYYQRNTWLV